MKAREWAVIAAAIVVLAMLGQQAAADFADDPPVVARMDDAGGDERTGRSPAPTSDWQAGATPLRGPVTEQGLPGLPGGARLEDAAPPAVGPAL